MHARALREHPRRARVAQGMEARIPEASAPGASGKGVAKGMQARRPSSRIWEDEIVLGAVDPRRCMQSLGDDCRALRPQQLQATRAKRERPRSPALGAFEHGRSEPLRVGRSDRHALALEVDILPLQRGDLALTRSRQQRKKKPGMGAGTLHRREQLTSFLGA